MLDETKSEELQSLADYIKQNHSGNQSAFGRSQGVQRAQVNQWLKSGYVVCDGKLLAVRRELEKGNDTSS